VRNHLTVRQRGHVPPAVMAALLFAAMAGATLVWMLWHDRYAGLLRLSMWIAGLRSGDPSLLTALGYFGSASLLLRYPSIDPDVDAAALGQAARLAGGAAIVAALCLAWRLRRTQPHWLLGFAWVLAWLLPLYALPLRHDAVSERHFYPALWGFALAVTSAFAQALRGADARPALGWALSIAILVAVSALTVVRNADYRSEVALWESASHAAPDKLRVQNNLGVAYMEAGRWEEACAVFTRALDANPDDSTLRWNLAAASARDLSVLRAPVLMHWNARPSGAPAGVRGCPS